MADINRQTEKVMAASISVTSCQSLFDDITQLQQNNNNSVLLWRLNSFCHLVPELWQNTMMSQFS